jgi:hypothetical protein
MYALSEVKREGLRDVLVQDHVLYPVLIRTRNSITDVDCTTCLTLLGAPREPLKNRGRVLFLLASPSSWC